MDVENGKLIFGYMAMMLEDREPWDPQVVYHRNRCKMDSHGNWWVSKKSSPDAPNLNHPFPGFDENGNPVPSEWWALWIDWQHPMATVMAAVQEAIDAAALAVEKAQAAEEAAEYANSANLSDHERRITELRASLDSLTENDIASLRSAVESLQDLIGANLDGVVNKFNEMVAFFAGMGEGDSLQAKLQELISLIASKQPAGDYATNGRVDELEDKVDSLVAPAMVGSHLTFPSRTAARMDGSHLILAE